MNANSNPVTASPSRKKALLSVAAVVGLVALVWTVWEWRVASHYESTDNAYVQGNIVQITPQVSGTVMAIRAEETDFVRAGQPLVTLDPADTRVALEQAEANLGQTVRQVRTLFANNGALSAQVGAREAEVARVQNELSKALDDLARRQSLGVEGAVSAEELGHAQSAVASARTALVAAQAAVQTAREQLAGNQVMTEGTTVEQHPGVRAAAARVREAWLAAQRGAVLAPVDGHVARRTVQLGQRVAAGAPLMTIVPLSQVWVDANFKEVQLRNIRLGQPAKLTADVYGQKVEYDGKVVGLGAGTGAAFSLLPAQNATGNWIKVVQRVPVRIALDARQVLEHPLRVGLSMDATVDISQRDGKALADVPRAGVWSETAIFSELDKGASEEVHRVIQANLGHALAGPRP